MGKIIDISSKFDTTKPKLIISGKEFEVNDSLETLIKFEEIMGDIGDLSKMEKAIDIALGKGASKEINVRGMSFNNLQYVIAGIIASIQGIEDVEKVIARFQEV